MQLARFKQFLKELRESDQISEATKSMAIYRYYLGKWYDEDDTILHESDIVKKLDLIMDRKSHWRERNSCETFFPIMSLNAVIMLTFVSPPRKQTRERKDKVIINCLQHSNDAFDATHDNLTGLLNIRSFDREFISQINSINIGRQLSAESISEKRPESGVATLVLDLDYFKQVNDSYGHDYGDIVLMCLAWRLENELERIKQKEEIDLEYCLGRSGGEEFIIGVSGVSVTATKSLAESLLHTIGSEVLPTSEEWEEIPSEKKPDGLNLPHTSERKITVSIGISTVLIPNSLDDLHRIVTNLRREADTALYRAKSGGRNLTRYYPEIRDSYGTVLEHHTATDVVVLDIGTHVGVSPGNEFLVYHPDFTGEKPFVFSDGRTVKRLGSYPRNPCGRLVVFEAQKEISFCRIAETKGATIFPSGSLLEFMPAGTISHLITHDPVVQPVKTPILSKPEKLEKVIEKAVDRDLNPLCIVFVLDDIEIIERTRGTAFVNQSLANLYTTIKEVFPNSLDISQIDPNKLAVVSMVDDIDNTHNLIQQVIDKATTICANLVIFGAGAFINRVSEIEGDSSTLDSKKALQYAIYAATKESREYNRIEVFSPETASNIVSSFRRRQKFNDGLANYYVFKKLGVTYANLENHGALCALEMENSDRDLALKLMKGALNLMPDDPTFIANLATIELDTGNEVRAHELFTEIEQKHSDYVLGDIYFPAKALAAYHMYNKSPGSVDQDVLIQLLMKAQESPLPINAEYTHQDINDALESLQ